MKMKEPKDEIRSRRRPKVNVLLVAAALLVPFTLFMWRIFGTKETPQQEGAAGINFSVPEGREQQIDGHGRSKDQNHRIILHSFLHPDMTDPWRSC